jgi:hypothetical protein
MDTQYNIKSDIKSDIKYDIKSDKKPYKSPYKKTNKKNNKRYYKKTYNKEINKCRNGIIYKIFHKTFTNIVYIGSTVCRLSTRWKRHKISFSNWNNGYTKSKCAICPYFKEYGIKNFDCILLKKYKIIDSKQLNAYEQLWMNKIKNINKNNVFNPIKFYKKKYKQSIKLEHLPNAIKKLKIN